MSSIEKLALRGVRAFSPFDEEKIEFFHPLTMILGQNGAGKTTIIEALRTMTSGQMPPHTGGGKTFVHDPRVSNLPETKASIKLTFNTIRGKPVFALRSFQLTNGRNKQEFRKLEQVLKAKGEETGAEISINKNCAEMDRQVPTLMGVSSAILENVVFCHQDESLWPFSDQANLKKIFDEIFDTTKYTKVLGELRATAKTYKKKAKDFKTNLDLLKKDYETYLKLKDEHSDTEKRIEGIVGKMKDLKERLRHVESELVELESQEQDMAREQKSLDALRAAIGWRQREADNDKTRLGLQGASEEEISRRRAESEK